MTRLPIVHISAYLLKIEPGTPFARQQIAAQCPDEERRQISTYRQWNS